MRNQYLYRFICVLVLACSFFLSAHAQEVKTDDPVPQARLRREGRVTEKDSLASPADTILSVENKRVDEALESIKEELEASTAEAKGKKGKKGKEVVADSTSLHLTLTTDSLAAIGGTLLNQKFVPEPKKALWLAIVFPGGGQIYNRKYWKIPLVYGGFLGCMYAMTWNNTMYRDYSQAYIDIMDSDDNTKSYENFIPSYYDIKGNLSRLQELFKRKKNFYRRYRDLSMFCMIGVYALSIVDAYVDAELSSFDISSDLSMKVHPTIINDRFSPMRVSGMNGNSYGLQCSLSF